MKNIRILAGVLACVGSMSATALQTPEWPYGFNEGDLKEEAVLSTANRQHGGWDGYENATNLSFLHFYVFPFLLGMTQAIEGQWYYPEGAVTEAPAISEDHRAFFEKLKEFERGLVEALNELLPPRPLPARSPQDLDSFKTECDQIADALPFPKNIRDYTKDIIKDAADKDRVCIAPTDSKKIVEFREKYYLDPYMWGGYSSRGIIDAVSSETLRDAVSVAFHESGHAAAYRFFNCANVDEVFSMFFQVAAFSTAVNIGNLSKAQSARIVREFLRAMFMEVRIVNFNREICEKGLFREEAEFDYHKYNNLICEVLHNLTAREIANSFHTSALSVERLWYSYNSGYYGFSLICALTEYIDFEEKLKTTPDDQKEKLFYYHLTRLKLLFEKPVLWKAYFLEGDKVKKAIAYLQGKIAQAPDDQPAHH
ncbi:MAG: hypothetical protein LBJ96_00315 [Holosporaceae bacterium]|jgi:hypothetical protein|nr:hypothetical protein [Holosporaceae bacterium]